MTRSKEARNRRASVRRAITDAELVAAVGPFSTDAAICAEPSCLEPAYQAGWCNAHLQRSRCGAAMEPAVRSRRCEVPKVWLLPRIRG